MLTSLIAAAADDAHTPPKPKLINVTDVDMLRTRRPVLIAHRGGVVSAQAPECSAAAIKAAAGARFDLVELDVRTSKDGVPIVFHDRSLKQDCGVDGRIADFTADEIAKFKYRGTDQSILTLDEALRLCKQLSLGVMFDIKQADDASLAEIVRLTRAHGLDKSAVTINGDPTIQKRLGAVSRIRLLSVEQADELMNAKQSKRPLKGHMWFGLPQKVPLDRIKDFQKAGALIIPGINIFRYPKGKDMKLAEQDIKKLRAAGVDGFQIDSVYQKFIK